MLSFVQALVDGKWREFIGKHRGDTLYVKTFEGAIEVCLEPLLFDDQYYLAIYDKDQNLLAPKIPIKPGKTEEKLYADIG